MAQQGYQLATRERVKKAADFELPTGRRGKRAFRIIGPVEKMVQDAKIDVAQHEGFKQFERDLALTNRSGFSRFNGSTGHGNVEDAAIAREDAYRRLADIAARHLDPKAYRALEAMAMNESSAVEIGRNILGIRNAPQARAAAEQLIDHGTWALGVYYGCITVRKPRPKEPG